MNNKQILGALALDLKRAALGYHRGSIVMGDKFFQEAIKRKNEIEIDSLKPYLVKLLNDMENLKKTKRDRIAEDALFYSTLFQNAAISK